MIHVSFQHWCHVFSDKAFIRYGSPHFDRHSAVCECGARLPKSSRSPLWLSP
jgi:hypothetical protein